jgi:hypothetical protein
MNVISIIFAVCCITCHPVPNGPNLLRHLSVCHVGGTLEFSAAGKHSEYLRPAISYLIFSFRDNVKPIVNGVRNALYSEVNSLEDGERRVRRAIEMGAAFIITQECSICGGVIHCQGSAAIACFF